MKKIKKYETYFFLNLKYLKKLWDTLRQIKFGQRNKDLQRQG